MESTLANARFATAVDIMKVYLQANPVSPADLPGLIREVFGALPDTGAAATAPLPAADVAAPASGVLSRVPVVPVEDSIRPDGIICLFDGVKKQMLKRHVRAVYGMEWSEYVDHFQLPKDYPSVAPGYSDKKRLKAIEQGLGSTIDKTPKSRRAPVRGAGLVHRSRGKVAAAA